MKMYASSIALGFLVGTLFFNPSLIQILFALIWLATAIEIDFNPIRNQITLHRERAQRRRNYEQFRAGVKSGLFSSDEQAEDEARRVIR